MPKKDPNTGCMVMTTGEFFQKEAEHEGKGRTGGDLMAEMFEEIGKEEEEHAKRISEPEEAKRILNEVIKENNSYLDDTDEGYIHFTVIGVIKVFFASVGFGGRNSSEGFLAVVEGDDGNEYTLKYSSWHSGGSYIDPPDGETIVEVLPPSHNCPANCDRIGNSKDGYCHCSSCGESGTYYDVCGYCHECAKDPANRLEKKLLTGRKVI